MCHLQRWLCGTLHRPPPTPLTLGALLFSLPLQTWIQPKHLTGKPEQPCSSPLRCGDEGGSYRVLLQLQPLPVGKGGPSLRRIPVWSWGNGPCFPLHSEHLTAGLVFVVRALPSIDDPGEEKLVRESDFWKAESSVSRVNPGSLHNQHKTKAPLHAQNLMVLVFYVPKYAEFFKNGIMLAHIKIFARVCSEISSPLQMTDSINPTNPF